MAAKLLFMLGKQLRNLRLLRDVLTSMLGVCFSLLELSCKLLRTPSLKCLSVVLLLALVLDLPPWLSHYTLPKLHLPTFVAE